MAINQRPRATGPGITVQAEWGGASLAGTLLGAALLIPSGVDYIGGFASHAPGSVLMTLIILLGLVHRFRFARLLVIGFVLGVAILPHLLFAALFAPIDYGRAAGSLVLIAFLLAAADCFGSYLFRLPDAHIARATAFMRWLMVLVGVMAALGLEPPGGDEWIKPTFPFTEPSHFALAFAPLLVDACVRSDGVRRIAWLLVGFALGYFLENLTMIVAVLVAAAVSLPINRPLPWIVALSSAVAILNLEYFADRIDFSGFSSSEGTNLSVLIYVQGWDLVRDAFDKTSGWGVGFQQLGLGYINSPAADRIYDLVGLELNQLDGGLLAAKVISEFGVFGALATLGFTVVAARSALALRRIASRAEAAPIGRIFALAIVCAFTVDVFVRGLSYFDGTTLLVAAALFHLYRQRAASRRIATGKQALAHP